VSELVLGPILRHVDADGATVWVETDSECEVEVAGTRSPTFEIEGHHYAVVPVDGLTAGEAVPYEVALDGKRAWPPADYQLPAPTIRPLARGDRARVVFGSCRVSLPHEPPFVLHQADHPEAQGIDALRALALRLARSEERTPDCLLMLGDQVYADDLSPAMREITSSRSDGGSAPLDELADFGEYALAYREAWCEPLIRWLLSTVPTAMIFDDHEINAQWKLSRQSQEKLEAHEWYERRISGGLMAYWVYQHLGNLSPRELREEELPRRVLATSGDAGPILREEMRRADCEPGHSRWSYCRDLGGSRLVVVDSRAGRELDPPERKMISEGEWEWIVERASGDYEHLLLASSLPFFLTPGLHHAEAWDARLADRGRTVLTRRLGERIREAAVMDHWASFPASFDSLCGLLGEIASGRHGRGSAPESIVMLSGDVHHCYLAEVGLPAEPEATSRIWQAVCSAYRKDLAPREKRAMRFGSSRVVTAIARRLARLAGAADPPADWRIVHQPCYENQVGQLEIGPGVARVKVESTEGSDWRDPELRAVFEQDLLAG
jgi:hypothetical protein